MNVKPREHRLDSEIVHYAWDRSIEPRLEVESGDIVTLEIRGGGDNYFHRHSTIEDLRRRPPMRGHPLTGPIRVHGARPGDALQVDILAVKPWDWGYTLIVPGMGLLQEDLPGPYLKIWEIGGSQAQFSSRIAVPVEPFLGILGVAPPDPGPHPTMPPRRWGGNLDIKQLTVGATLWLPVGVDGALFSAGDAHAAQGDGEVCVTAIETGATATVRLSLVGDAQLAAPEFQTGGPLIPRTNARPWHATTGISDSPATAAREAVRGMIHYLGRTYGLTDEQAYVLCSVAVDLKISEAVDAPNWVVSAFLPLSIFEG
jgi:acetamidase/formamidase